MFKFLAPEGWEWRHEDHNFRWVIGIVGKNEFFGVHWITDECLSDSFSPTAVLRMTLERLFR